MKAVLKEEIAALADAGVTCFYSGCADGADAWASLILLSLCEKDPTLRLHCVLPHEEQTDKWDDLARDRYHFILEQADHMEYMSREYDDSCMIGTTTGW